MCKDTFGEQAINLRSMTPCLQKKMRQKMMLQHFNINNGTVFSRESDAVVTGKAVCVIWRSQTELSESPLRSLVAVCKLLSVPTEPRWLKMTEFTSWLMSVLPPVVKIWHWLWSLKLFFTPQNFFFNTLMNQLSAETNDVPRTHFKRIDQEVFCRIDVNRYDLGRLVWKTNIHFAGEMVSYW